MHRQHTYLLEYIPNQASSADWDDVIPVTPCHWDDIIPMDGGWLPHWDEALDESIGINAVYLTT